MGFLLTALIIPLMGVSFEWLRTQPLVSDSPGREWARSFYVNDLYVRVSSLDQSLPYLICEPGLSSHSLGCSDLSRGLKDRYNVLAIDRLGYGFSRVDVEDETEITLDHVHKRRLAVLDAVAPGRQVDYLGFSMGGLYALDFYRRSPERVRSLILVDPPMPRRRLIPQFKRLDEQFLGMDRILDDQIAWARFGYLRLKYLVKQKLRGRTTQMEQSYGVAYLKSFKLEASRMGSMARGMDWKSPIDVPVLVVGRGSPQSIYTRVVNQALTKLVTTNQRARMVIVPDTPHVGLLDLESIKVFSPYMALNKN